MGEGPLPESPGRELLNTWEGTCFGCSPNNPHGLQLRFHLSNGGCRATYTIPDHLCGFDGVAHGGIITLLLDEVSQWTVIGRLGRLGLTRDITVRFIKPVRTGVEIEIEAEVVERDEQDVMIRATVRDTTGDVLAESQSRWLLADLGLIARIARVEEHTLETFLSSYPADAPLG